MEEENTMIIMTSLSTLSPSNLTKITHSILSLSHNHRRRLAAVLSSPTLFSLILRHLLSLSLPQKTLLIATHLLSLLQPLILLRYRDRHSLSSSANMKLRDLDAVVLLLFLCETHQLDPNVLESSADDWREILGNMCSDTMLNNISGLWTCDAGILMPYIETLVRCKRFVDIMGSHNHFRRQRREKENNEVPAARAAVVALRAVQVFNSDATSNMGEIECVICKEEMCQGRDVCEMPCQHLFHWKCILPWLSKKNTCPFCRFQLPTDDVFSEIQRLWEILVKTNELHARVSRKPIYLSSQNGSRRTPSRDRPSKGKARNRRYISRKGPLVVYGTEGSKIVKAFRNIHGVELCHVERLNLLKLAPGGHLGRFVIWTKSAFEKLESIYGSFEKQSEKKKKGYVLPRAKMVNADIARIINSDEVQSVVKPINKDSKRAVMKKNPLKNLNVMLKLNPYAKTAKRMSLLAESQRIKSKKDKLEKKRKIVTKEEAQAIKAAGKAWYQTMISDSDYTEFDNFTKWLGATQ